MAGLTCNGPCNRVAGRHGYSALRYRPVLVRSLSFEAGQAVAQFFEKPIGIMQTVFHKFSRFGQDLDNWFNEND